MRADTGILAKHIGIKSISDDGNYLENPVEIEGFQNQIEFISDTKGKDAAEEYTEQVLESHDEEDNQECKSKLME